MVAATMHSSGFTISGTLMMIWLAITTKFLRRLLIQFYFGESVLLPAYRGMGIGVEFFHHRESWARSLNQFNRLTFCAVVRPDDHPMKPKDFKSLDAFWQKRGFVKTKELTCQMHWQDIDQQAGTMKSLHFWEKHLI